MTVRSGSVAVKIYRVRQPKARLGYVFSLAYSSPEGRKVRQFAALEEAKQEAQLAADRIATGHAEASNISRSNGEELIAARRLTGEVPLLSALQEWSKARSIVGYDLIPACEAWRRRETKCERILVGALVDLFLAAKSAQGVNIKASYKSRLTGLKRDMGSLYLDSISTRAWEAWLALRKDPVTRNTDRKRVVTLCRWARRQGYLPREITTEAEMTERSKEPPPSRSILKASELEALLNSFRDRRDLLPAIVISALCGLRSIEVHRQNWEDIDFAQKHLRVTMAKEGTPADRPVPLPACGVAWLRLVPESERVGRIHPHKTEVMTLVRNLARKRGVGIPDNALRKSWVSYRLALTKNLAATALEAGHTATVAIRNYLKWATPAEAARWFRILPKKRPNPGGAAVQSAGIKQVSAPGLAALQPGKDVYPVKKDPPP